MRPRTQKIDHKKDNQGAVMKSNLSISSVIALAALALSQPASAISILFDYTYDSSGFFTGGNASRQTLLTQAASEFTSRIQDHLTAITSSGSNSFDIAFYNPSNASVVTLNNYSVTDNAVIVYVGAQNLGASTLGQGGPGGYSISGSSAFVDGQARGQAGALNTPATDFGPWGGSISFNSAQSNWYFGSANPTPGSGLYDFYSVAVHELGHVLGFGTAESFGNLVMGSNFTGASSSGLYGGPVPLADSAHWQDGLTSTAGGVPQEVAMDPAIGPGTRKHFTELDFAALRDTGWQIAPVPIPAAVWLFASGLVGIFGFARRRMG